MSVVQMTRDTDTPRATTGGAMDKVVARRTVPMRIKAAVAGGLILAAGTGFYAYAPGAQSQSVVASRLTVSTVTDGRFEDFLPLRARVTPLVTVFLDAVEGGRVEKIYVEDGATVQKGQLLAELSNADLQLSTLARETEVAEQLNNLRVTELSLSRTRLQNERDIIQADLDAQKAKRQFDLQRPLAERGFVAGRTFNDTRDDYAYQLKRNRVLRTGQATDERLQSSQLAQLRATAAALQSALAIARGNLDQLRLRAPVAGQLTAFSIQVGQSAQRGERLGQIDSPGRNKLEAGIDEFYLGRVAVGQTAAVDYNGRTYRLRIAKIYPQVQNGQFRADLQFIGAEPAGMQRGQTMQAKLTLSDPVPARLIPNGAFYNDTGGTWVFVVAPDGRSAERRTVRLGRRNADFIEVLDGLDPGERVVTSPYTGMVDKTRLDLSGR